MPAIPFSRSEGGAVKPCLLAGRSHAAPAWSSPKTDATLGFAIRRARSPSTVQSSFFFARPRLSIYISHLSSSVDAGFLLRVPGFFEQEHRSTHPPSPACDIRSHGSGGWPAPRSTRQSRLLLGCLRATAASYPSTPDRSLGSVSVPRRIPAEIRSSQ